MFMFAGITNGATMEGETKKVVMIKLEHNIKK